MVGIVKSVESPGFACSPLNFCQLSQTSRFGTAKKKVSILMLSIRGKIGVAILANPYMLTLKVSPGRASSRKIGTSHPESKVVL